MAQKDHTPPERAHLREPLFRPGLWLLDVRHDHRGFICRTGVSRIQFLSFPTPKRKERREKRNPANLLERREKGKERPKESFLSSNIYPIQRMTCPKFAVPGSTCGGVDGRKTSTSTQPAQSPRGVVNIF